MSKILVLTEKPSVAKDIARVLGCRKSGIRNDPTPDAAQSLELFSCRFYYDRAAADIRIYLGYSEDHTRALTGFGRVLL